MRPYFDALMDENQQRSNMSLYLQKIICFSKVETIIKATGLKR